MDKDSDPRLQLVPVDASARLMLVFLCVLLPLIITAASLLWASQGAAREPAGGSPALASAAILAGLLALTLALWFVLDRAMLRHRVRLTALRLEVKSGFYSQSLPLSELQPGQARVVDLDERTGCKPRIKTNGFALPGFSSGYFRLRKGRKAFVAIAGGPPRAVVADARRPRPAAAAPAAGRPAPAPARTGGAHRRAAKLRRCATAPVFLLNTPDIELWPAACCARAATPMRGSCRAPARCCVASATVATWPRCCPKACSR